MVTKLLESGFCFGVRNSVNKAMTLEKEISAGKKVFLYGDLVNNSHVMSMFLKKNYYVVNDANLIPRDSIAVIRAHGIPRDVYNELTRKNIDIIDCTCVNVKKIHEIVSEKSSTGYKIIVVGKARHPEVIGIAGWCSSGSALIIEKESDLDCIDLSGNVCVVAQTTFNKELWEKIVDIILKKNNFAEINNTLCDVTSNREEKAKKIAETADIMLIIGDCKSSNSRELYEQCLSVSGNTYSIHSLDDNSNNFSELCDKCDRICKRKCFTNSILNLEDDNTIKKVLSDSNNIGLAASASTPDNVISDIYNYLLFMDFIKIAKKEIEDASNVYFNVFKNGTINNSFIQESLGSLYNQNEGGKRIRGAMIKLGEMIASNERHNNYLPIAVGYELFQTSVLIHDDVFDRSDKRRNKTTIHIEAARKIKEVSGDNITDAKAMHYGISSALCIGDYGFFISYKFLEKCNLGSDVLLKIYQLYSQILTITCEGEIMDVLLPFEKKSILDNYDEYTRTINLIYEFKTAWYTLAGPIMLGAICGGANEELLELLKNISIPLGIAFQIKDDLLGMYATEKVLGKSELSDIREKKQTLMYGFAYKNASSQQRELLDKHYGKENANIEDLETVRKLFKEIGAKKYAEDEINRLSKKSKDLVDNKLIDIKYQSILYGFINYQIGRKF